MNSQLTKLIKVKDDTYERLSNRGEKNETYDDIIRKLLDLAENENNKKYGYYGGEIREAFKVADKEISNILTMNSDAV